MKNFGKILLFFALSTSCTFASGQSEQVKNDINSLLFGKKKLSRRYVGDFGSNCEVTIRNNHDESIGIQLLQDGSKFSFLISNDTEIYLDQDHSLSAGVISVFSGRHQTSKLFIKRIFNGRQTKLQIEISNGIGSPGSCTVTL